MTKKRQPKVKNWKLALLAIVLIACFTGLGFWQLSRAHQKQSLVEAFAARTLHNPFDGKDLNNLNDWRFYRAKLNGEFDNAHTILLDNKTLHGKVGYEVFTPFRAKGMDLPILVDRGFVPAGDSRSQLPTIADIKGPVTIIGMLNLPPLHRSLGDMKDTASGNFPLRLEFIQLPEIEKLLNSRIFPYTLNMDPKDPRAYAIEWQIIASPPEKHLGYAVQWFALALTLLILFVALNRAR